jgi:hypothetical protein
MLMKLEFPDRYSENTDIKFHENPSSKSRVVPCGQMDVRLGSHDDGRPHDTVTVPEVAYAVNFIDLLMMDTECARNM